MSDDIFFSVGGYIQAGSYGFNPTVGTNGLAANFYVDGNAGITGMVFWSPQLS